VIEPYNVYGALKIFGKEPDVNDSTLMRFRIDDPYCPRVDASMTTPVLKSTARSRFDENARRRIAEYLSLPLPLNPETDGVIDEIAAWVVRLEHATEVRSQPGGTKNTLVSAKKTLVSAKPSIPDVQRKSTQEIVTAAQTLHRLLQTATHPVKARLSRQFGDITESGQTRKETGIDSLNTLLGALEQLCTAADRADQRIRIPKGRNDGGAVNTFVHQLARLWVSHTDAEPTQSKKKGTFSKFVVETVFQEAHLSAVDQTNAIRKVVKWRQKKYLRDDDSDNEASDEEYPDDSDAETNDEEPDKW
jgi:hypothetical protein